MGKVLFTSDLHFGHENVIRFDGRPFSTVEEMDNELIRRWNEKVAPGDLVYVLGDFIWKSRNDDAAELIRSLQGQIILIKGNHDRFLHNAKAKDATSGRGFVSKEERKIRQQIAKLEEVIESKEKELKEIEERLANPEEGADIMGMTDKYLQCKSLLDARTAEWEGLIESLE